VFHPMGESPQPERLFAGERCPLPRRIRGGYFVFRRGQKLDDNRVFAGVLELRSGRVSSGVGAKRKRRKTGHAFSAP